MPVGCYRIGRAMGSSDKEEAGPNCTTQQEGRCARSAAGVRQAKDQLHGLACKQVLLKCLASLCHHCPARPLSK